MRKPLLQLLALPALALAGVPAAAQSVYIETGPAEVEIYRPDVEVIDEEYDAPEYDTVRVYTYTRRVYRHRYRGDGDRRVYYYASPPYPEHGTTVIRVRPPHCGYNRYWHDGRCVDAVGRSLR